VGWVERSVHLFVERAQHAAGLLLWLNRHETLRAAFLPPAARARTRSTHAAADERQLDTQLVPLRQPDLLDA